MKRIFVIVIGRIVSLPFVSRNVRDFLMWPIATRLLGKNYTQIVTLKDGFKMIGSMEDILSRQILFIGAYRYELWEPKTTILLKTLAQNSRQILIAGAHMGYDVLLAASRTKGIVHAFEPVPALYKRAKENIALNPEIAKRCVLTPNALGEKEGKVDFFVENIRSSAIAYGGGHKKEHIITVPVTTIDRYASTHDVVFDLMLLDIEGFEWYALNGATDTLQHKPKLILEVSPKILAHTQITSDMIFSRLATLKYRVEYLDQDVDYANIYAKPEID